MKNQQLFFRARKALFAVLAAASFVSANPAQALPTNNVPQQITGNVFWSRTNIYQMNGACFVMSNAVLTIEAGTVIKGKNVGSQGTNVSALYVTVGGKIYAEGTPNHPIIFTADQDDTTIPDDLPIWGPTSRGLWGGLVIFGNSTINSAQDTVGNAQPYGSKYEVYEGLPDLTLGGQQVFRFGGNNENDNSGVLRYVSIRHGGAVLAPNKEINGLSLGAVGRGTTVEYVESYCAADDGFEFFGGTVNTKYLVSSFNDDDSFDTDQGYNGTNQFWFAVQAPDKRNYGMEMNSQPNELINSNNTAPITPMGTFKVYNITIIGAGTTYTNQDGGANDAVTLRPFASPTIVNGLFTDFAAQGIRLDTQGGLSGNNVVNSNYATIKNTLWWGFVTNIGTVNQTVDNSTRNLARGNALGETFFTTTSFTNQIANPLLRGISRTNVGTFLDPRPSPGSPAFSNAGAVPNDGFLTQTDYRGAFGSNDLWIAKWTALAEYGILQKPSITTNVVPQQITGNVFWSRTNIYQMNGACFVMSNAVLTIEAGTVIKGKNVGSQGTNVSALYVTVGGKIYAEGTPQNPIIFTADQDDTTIPDDMPIWGAAARGLWGGLVIFGSSTINSAQDTTGNAQPYGSKYEVYEGLADITLGGQQVFRFGGNNENDNSGVIRYVSIRHGGAVLAPNKEINGLSLGAVGRGTTIEYVESYCAADDGFEFFGGTVNTKYLVSSFNDDDSFDTDQGYNGTNQFWFAVQAPDKRNYGMELNSQPNELISSTNTTPITPMGTFKVYNITIIGAGTTFTNQDGGVNDGVTLRPFASPTIVNGLFTEFAGQGLRLDTQGGLSANNVVNSNYATIRNTLWWNVVTNIGLATQTIDNSTRNMAKGNATAETFFTTTSFTNQIANPLLRGISRTNVGIYLDPRPNVGSPASTGFATAPSGFATANYRGAFDTGRANWAADWTALSEYGIMGGAGGINFNSASSTVVVTPNQPFLVTSRTGGNLNIVFTSQAGFTYQLQSRTNLSTGTWADEGGATAGTGGSLTNTVPTTGIKFFRVKVQ